MNNNANNPNPILFLGNPELQASVLKVFSRIHSESFPDAAIRRILTESLLNFVDSQTNVAVRH